jgi:hypothetical protein
MNNSTDAPSYQGGTLKTPKKSGAAAAGFC